MTTDRNELLERLNDLRQLSTKKKYQLAKPEQEEALTVLSALVTQDKEGYQVCLQSLPEFPSDVGAELLANHWQDLVKRQLPVARDLSGPSFGSDLGKRLRLALSQRLLQVAPASALRLLIDVCRDVKPAKKPLPITKDLGLIRAAFLEGGVQSLGRLPIADAMDYEMDLLVSYVLAAAFVPRKKTKTKKAVPPATQLAVLRWANSYPKLRELTGDLTTAITDAIKTWDGDYRGIIASEKDSLQEVLRTAVAQEHPSAPPPSKTTTPAAPTQEATATANAESSPRSHYDALYELGRLTKYVRQLETGARQSRKELVSAQNDWQQTRNELVTAQREKEEAKRQAAVARSDASDIARAKTALEKQLEKLRSELQKAETQLEAADDKHNQALASHGDQLDTLSERIAREGAHRVDGFRKGLGAKIRTYAEGLQEASDMEMTTDLGVALRNQMKQLLRLLASEGIQIDGGR